MNDAGTKRLALIKSLVREQGADGDKCWLIVQLETEARKNKRLLAYVDGNDKDVELEAAEQRIRELEEMLDLAVPTWRDGVPGINFDPSTALKEAK